VLKLKNWSSDPDHAPLGWSVILRLGHNVVYLCTKIDDSSLSRSKDIIGAQKFKIAHVTVTTPLLRVFVVLMKGLDIAYLI